MQLPIVMPVILALLLSASGASAGFTTESCLAAKLTAAGNFRKCHDGVRAKVLQGKPSDVAKCSTKLQDKIAKLSGKASKAGIGCRYGDNGDGTVTDYDTGLQWEMKDSADGIAHSSNPHDVDNLYDWSSSGTAADGTAFTTLLSQLNSCSFAPGFFGSVGFAGHCDWRLPTLAELQTILEPASCGMGPCIDPTFGATAAFRHWSSTADASDAGSAWTVSFGSGSAASATKNLGNRVRAVREDF